MVSGDLPRRPEALSGPFATLPAGAPMVQAGGVSLSDSQLATHDDALGKGDLYTARLTLDITPAMRARIKVSAFTQGVTVADLLRALLEREFPEKSS